MDNKKINLNPSNAILLNDSDNIIIAIDNMKANQYLEDFDITLDAQLVWWIWCCIWKEKR